MKYQFTQHVKIADTFYQVGIREVPEHHEEHPDFERHARAGFIADVDAGQVAAQPISSTADRSRMLHERMLKRKQTSVPPPPEPVREPVQDEDAETESECDDYGNELPPPADGEPAGEQAPVDPDAEGEEDEEEADGEEQPPADGEQAAAKPKRNRAKKTTKGE